MAVCVLSPRPRRPTIARAAKSTARSCWSWRRQQCFLLTAAAVLAVRQPASSGNLADLEKKEQLDEDRLSSLDDQLESLDESRRAVFSELRGIRKQIRRVTATRTRAQAQAAAEVEPAQLSAQEEQVQELPTSASSVDEGPAALPSQVLEGARGPPVPVSSTESADTEELRAQLARVRAEQAASGVAAGAQRRAAAAPPAHSVAAQKLPPQVERVRASTPEVVEQEPAPALSAPVGRYNYNPTVAVPLPVQSRAPAGGHNFYAVPAGAVAPEPEPLLQPEIVAARPTEAAPTPGTPLPARATSGRTTAPSLSRMMSSTSSSSESEEDPDDSFHQYMREEDGEDEVDSAAYQESARALSGATGWEQSKIESKANDAVKSLTQAIGGKKVVRSLQGMLAGLR